MPEDHDRAGIVRIEDELLANPQQVFRILFLELARRKNSRMHEEVERPQVAQRERSVKLHMLGRQQIDRVIEVGLGDAVAVHGGRAAVEEKRLAVMSVETEEG